MSLSECDSSTTCSSSTEANLYNMIPVQQRCNQTWDNIVDILTTLPDMPKTTEPYNHIKLLLSEYSEIIRIDVTNGVHKPFGDNYHFNIRVYETINGMMIHDNLHVYVVFDRIETDTFGNPVMMWKISRFLQITE